MLAQGHGSNGKGLLLAEDSSPTTGNPSSQYHIRSSYSSNNGGHNSSSGGFINGGQHYSSDGYTHGGNNYNSGGFRGSNFRGRSRGRNNFGTSRFSGPHYNPGPGILGPARSHVSTCSEHGNDVPICQICAKRCHIASDCFQRHSPTPVSSSSIQCQICWKFGHSAIQCYHRANFSYQGRSPSPTLTAMNATYQPSAPHEQFWVADTGATSYMTSDLANLNLATPFTGNDIITTASGSGQDHRENTSSGAV
ncbi:trihydrophobin-like [Pyrus x bretschneideri]|uniref:trihydrophobin-like n=1 Tax=Pyrus x bretschneideri TaxID=225117 RepID=UPI00203008BE|nr:trihydrophobin-like [Pyrus x bretschneideri]